MRGCTSLSRHAQRPGAAPAFTSRVRLHSHSTPVGSVFSLSRCFVCVRGFILYTARPPSPLSQPASAPQVRGGRLYYILLPYNITTILLSYLITLPLYYSATLPLCYSTTYERVYEYRWISHRRCAAGVSVSYFLATSHAPTHPHTLRYQCPHEKWPIGLSIVKSTPN